MLSRPKTSRIGDNLRIVVLDIRQGMLEVSRQSLALVGLAVIALGLALFTQPALQASAIEWLQAQWVVLGLGPADNDPDDLSTRQLPKEQAQATLWLSRKYHVSPYALRPLVVEAWTASNPAILPAPLTLSVIGVESRFNPYALGTQGARGLMQLSSQDQAENLARFGGPLALFDPLTNLRLGARQLQQLIETSGSCLDGLRQFAQVSGQSDIDAYVQDVLGDYRALQQVIGSPDLAPACSQTPST